MITENDMKEIKKIRKLRTLMPHEQTTQFLIYLELKKLNEHLAEKNEKR